MKPIIKICLFNPIPVNSYPPLNLTYLASYLREYGKYDYEIKLVDSNFSDSPVKEIVDFQPDIIGFTSLSSYSLEIYDKAKLIRKECPDALLICGGVHATINPGEVELSRSAAARWRPFQHSFFTFQASNSSILPP